MQLVQIGEDLQIEDHGHKDGGIGPVGEGEQQGQFVPRLFGQGAQVLLGHEEIALGLLQRPALGAEVHQGVVEIVVIQAVLHVVLAGGEDLPAGLRVTGQRLVFL